MDTLKDLVAACRDATGPVIETPARTAPYTYEDFVPNVWKSGNLLGHYGVHPGAEVTVVAGPKDAGPQERSRRIDTADPLFATLGATMVGAAVRLQPAEPVDSRALVVPAGWADRYETTPKCTTVAYGGPPTDPNVVHFEEQMWSENPIEPPEQVAPEDAALRDQETTYSHGTLLSAGMDLVDEYDLDADSDVVLDAPVTEPGALVALLGTLAAKATLELQQETGEGSGAEGVLVTTDRDDRDDVVTVDTLTQRLRDTPRV